MVRGWEEMMRARQTGWAGWEQDDWEQDDWPWGFMHMFIHEQNDWPWGFMHLFIHEQDDWPWGFTLFLTRVAAKWRPCQT